MALAWAPLATDANSGSLTSKAMKAIIRLVPLRNWRAASFGTNLSSLIASSMRTLLRLPTSSGVFR